MSKDKLKPFKTPPFYFLALLQLVIYLNFAFECSQIKANITSFCMDDSTKIRSLCENGQECPLLYDSANIFRDSFKNSTQKCGAKTGNQNLNTTCTKNDQCKSNNCNVASSKCQQGIGQNGSLCTYNDQCNNHLCEYYQCSGQKRFLNMTCESSIQCLSLNCSNQNKCIQGTKTNDSGCESNQECQSKLCFQNKCSINGLQFNSICENNQSRCLGDLQCIISQQTSSEKFCLAPVGQNSKCSNTQQCLSDLYCRNSRCVKRIDSQQESCSDDQQCKSGRCLNSRCATKYQQDHDCSSSDQCDRNLFCQEHKRCDQLKIGDFCQEDRECPIDSFCDGQKCVSKRSIMQSCTSDHQCMDQLYCTRSSQSRICTSRANISQACNQNIKCLKSLYCNYSNLINGICSKNSTHCHLNEHQSCGPQKYCGPQSTCLVRSNTGQSCNQNILCNSNDFCNSSNQCQSKKRIGCNSSSECIDYNKCTLKTCQPKLGLDQACNQNSDCVTNNCNSLLCKNGNLDNDSACSNNSECKSNLCTGIQNVKKCLRYKNQNQYCEMDSDCGAGMICTQSRCTYMFSIENNQQASQQRLCKTNNLITNGVTKKCSNVQLQIGGVKKHYPYYCKGQNSNCTYSGLQGGDQILMCSETNGFCEIKVGMPQYTSYYQKLLKFYKLKEVKQNLSEPARRLTDIFKLADYFQNYQNAEVQNKIKEMKVIYSKLQYSNIIYQNCNLDCLPLNSNLFQTLMLTNQFKFCKSQKIKISCEIDDSDQKICASHQIDQDARQLVKFYYNSNQTIEQNNFWCQVLNSTNQFNFKNFSYSHTFQFRSYNQTRSLIEKQESDQKVLTGGACRSDKECSIEDFCSSFSLICQKRKVLNQTCAKTSECQPGMQCIKIEGQNICKQFYSIENDQVGTATTCKIGRVAGSKCSTNIKIYYQNTQLSYPYQCQPGKQCQYRSEKNQIYSQNCSKINAFKNHGHCPIIPGVKEYQQLYIEKLKDLVSPQNITNCSRDVQNSGLLSVELDKCSLASDDQKKQAWGGFFFLQYFNLLFSETTRPCSNAIVSNHQIIRDNKQQYLPRYLIPNINLVQFPPPNIQNNSSKKVVNQTLDLFINRLQDDTYVLADYIQEYKKSMQQIISNRDDLIQFLPKLNMSLYQGI